MTSAPKALAPWISALFLLACGGKSGSQNGAGGAGGSGTQPACGRVMCGGAAPVCDTTMRTCRACATSTECASISAAASICAPSGACVECDATKGCMDPTRPVCAHAGTCVECDATKDCTTATRPLCNLSANTCTACGADEECTKLVPGAPACAPSGACVECTVSMQCGTGAKPICDSGTNTCRGCNDGTECAAANATTQACVAGSCVECMTNNDCKAASKPICEVATNTCRGCQEDSECTTSPNVCMKHQDGRCATDAETIYVQQTAGCPAAAATADGTAAMPYCSMDPAVGAAGAIRDLVVVRGTVASATLGFSGTVRQISIVGQMNAIVTGAHTGIHLFVGDGYVRSLQLGPSTVVGCQADLGSKLRLDHVVVTGNSGGGILVDGGGFDIENTTVTNNGPATFNGLRTWGGILVNNPPSPPNGLTKLQFVTVQNNVGGGITCSAAYATSNGVLVSGNTSGLDVDTTCGFASCGAPGATCGAQP
jgi:hypothetical protein